MSISPVTHKIDLPLMRHAECVLCTETVMDKVLKRALYTESSDKKTDQHELSFFGHMSLGKETGSIIPHLVCEECNPEILKQSTLKDTARKCFSCNIVLKGNWREKYTWDKSIQAFKIESAPLPLVKISEKIKKNTIFNARNLTIGATSFSLSKFSTPVVYNTLFRNANRNMRSAYFNRSHKNTRKNHIDYSWNRHRNPPSLPIRSHRSTPSLLNANCAHNSEFSTNTRVRQRRYHVPSIYSCSSDCRRHRNWSFPSRIAFRSKKTKRAHLLKSSLPFYKTLV